MNEQLQQRIDAIKEEAVYTKAHMHRLTDRYRLADSLLVAIEAIERIHESLAVIPALRAQEALTKICDTWEGKGK